MPDSLFAFRDLEHPENAHLELQKAKATLVARDCELVLEMAKCHQSTRHISDPRIACFMVQIVGRLL